MATIYNSELIDGLIKKIKMQLSRDSPPTQLAEKIVPVIIVDEPKNIIVIKAASNAVTGNVEAYTTPSDQDFYLSSVSLSTESSAAADNTETVAFCTPNNGIQGNFLSILKTTLVAQSSTKVITFNPAIKCKRSTIVGAYTSYTVGANVKSIAITGYLLNKD